MKIKESYYIAEKINEEYYPISLDGLFDGYEYDNFNDAEYDLIYLQSDYPKKLYIVRIAEEIVK